MRSERHRGIRRNHRRAAVVNRPHSERAFGHEIEAVVERIVPGGLGLAHGEGRTLFIARAAPGDRVRIEIDRERGRVAHATIREILDPGPDRVPEAHPLLSRCGADFQHLRYDAQLIAKGEMIADSLRRIGGLDLAARVEVQPSPAIWGYRGIAAWRHDPAAPALGYVAAGTHHVIDVPDDPFVVPALSDRFASVRARFAAGTLPPWTTEIRAAAGQDGVSLAPPLDAPQPLPVHTVAHGERLTYDADCFFQANPFVLDALVTEALRFADQPAPVTPRRAVDLYCGVGLFTLPLARRFDQVIGVEGHPRAAAFATRNIAAAGLDHARVRVMPVEHWLEETQRTPPRLAFVLLDPPRTGLPPAARNTLPRLRAERITYVSCDPATLARDVKVLCAEGYEIDAVAAFDMFPQTHHVETVVHLRRRDLRR